MDPEQNTGEGLRGAGDYPLDAWYAVARDVELRHELLARRVCDTPLAVYRKLDGTAVALEDCCWHRMLPLTKGRLVGDDFECGYHGLRYDATGRCTHMPSQAIVNPNACVRSFPVVERHRYVWVWLGAAALADEQSVPDLHENHDPGWAGDGELMHARCNYKLVLDNLMDLTHETFVHKDSIGQSAVAETAFVTHHGRQVVQVTRWMIDVDAPPFWAKQLGKPGRVDRWQIIRFQAPGTITIDVGVAPTGTGAPEGDRSQGVNGMVINTVTPETRRTCHYFWAFVRNYRREEQAITHELRAGVSRIFKEDELVLEAQQRAVDEFPGRTFYDLNIDAGGVWARRQIAAMIDAEQRPHKLTVVR
jgi:phenylpropionate dioxygenase-like ring-hydroxylating dioxygenase large terminal subunit